MRLTQIHDNILLIEFETKKELTLTFFRIQEFYESLNPRLNSVHFSVFDFLHENVKDDGTIDYFSFWEGFNFPDFAIKEWVNGIAYTTPYEKELLQLIDYAWNKKFYVIGTLEGDKRTIEHELAHALYYIDDVYMYEASDLYTRLCIEENRVIRKMVRGLLELDYSQDVLIDEIQAYLLSEKSSYIKKHFGVDTKQIKKHIKPLKKLFKKYKADILNNSKKNKNDPKAPKAKNTGNSEISANSVSETSKIVDFTPQQSNPVAISQIPEQKVEKSKEKTENFTAGYFPSAISSANTTANT